MLVFIPLALSVRFYILKVLLIILACLLGFIILSQIISRIMVKLFHHSPPVSYVTGPILDSRIRTLIQPPLQVIKRSGLKKSMKVLDLGCGSGMFTVYAARAVGRSGLVYALDIQQEMLKQLKEKLSSDNDGKHGIVIPVKGNARNLPFRSGSLDLVYIISTLQEIADRQKALGEVKRALKPGGVLAISETVVDIDYFLKSTVIKICQEAGFTLDSISGNFWSYTVRFINR